MGKLFAAVSVRDITPTPDELALINQDGYYNYDGIKRRLFLKTLVLTDGQERFVYFGTDLSNFTLNEEAQQLFMERLGLAPKDYMVGTNRSHNTVSSWGADLHDKRRPGTARYGRRVIDLMAETVAEAMSKLVPARIGSKLGHSNINCSRENCTPAGNFEGMYHGALPAPWLRVVRVEDMAGETIALLVNYSMQNCMVAQNAFIGEYNYITSDLAGEIVDFLETAGKHKYPVIWSNGGGADRQPLIYSLLDRCDIDENGEFQFVHEILPIDATLMLMRHLACEQGLDVIRTVRAIDNYSDQFQYFSGYEYVEVPGKVSLFMDRHINFYRPGIDDVSITPAAPVKFRYAMAVVNDIAFCGVNAPVYSGAYEKLMEMLPFPVIVFSDDNFGSMAMASIPLPEAEENDQYVHATLQSRSYTARIGFNAYMSAFGKLMEKYALKTVYTYKGAPHPDDIPQKK